MSIVGDAAKKGDKLALEVIKEEGRLLGIWLGGMISVLDPEIIVVGGGVSLIGEMLLKPIRENIQTRTINLFAKDTPIVQAGLKHDVGILGAASIML